MIDNIIKLFRHISFVRSTNDDIITFIKNRLKIALRRLTKQRVYTLINLIGLITGVTSTILILHFS